MTDAQTPAQDASAIWVYALAECGAGATPAGLAGVAGAQVRLAAVGGLTAVVSDVSLEEFGEEALRRNLEDLAWLEAVARAHHGVIEAAARRFTLLPMRLAIVYSDEASMRAAITADADWFCSALERLRSRTEWGVKAYAAPATPGSTPGRPEPAAEGDEAGSGLAYLRRRREQLSARRDAARDAADSARTVHAELARHAAESRLHPPQSARLSGRSEPMVLNAAYLLDDDRADGFAETVRALSDRNPRLCLELTGPWPPYSFAAPELEPELADRGEARNDDG
jgi:Gas vesicle synthesis protein GvpL/GvpF